MIKLKTILLFLVAVGWWIAPPPLHRLQIVNDKIDRMDQKIERVEQKVDKLEFKLGAHIVQNRREFDRNHQDHLQLMQLINETDIEIQELKRVKLLSFKNLHQTTNWEDV